MASNIYGAIGLVGGSNGYVDTIKDSVIADGDMCIAIVGGATDTAYIYTFDDSSASAESSPDVIKPDDAAGNGRWILCSLQVTDLVTTGDLTVGNDLDVTASLTCADLDIGSSTVVSGVLDEDNMASDSDTDLATQQSIKAYIDTIVGTYVSSIDDLAGFIIRPHIQFASTTSLTIGPGRLHLLGTAQGEDVYKWDSALTFTCESGGSNAASDDFGTSEWHYLYIDDSALAGDGATLLTNAQFLNSTTAPTWDASEGGWYNGADRCIFAFWVNGAGAITEFFVTDKEVRWADLLDLGTSWTTSWQDVTLTVPAFSTNVAALTTVHASPGAYYGYYYWRTNGQTGGTGHLCGWSYNSGGGDNRRDNTLWHGRMVPDTGGVVEVKSTVASAGTNTLFYQDGYVLPEGM